MKDIRSFFKKKKDEGSEAQVRLEDVEEELSPVADSLGYSKVKGNEMLNSNVDSSLIPPSLKLISRQHYL